MRLNTRMRYGTRAMLELALRYEQGAVSLGEIAKAQGLSEKYLESLFSALKSAGLVLSRRGAQGGYVLARPPAQITLRQVFDVLEGPEPYAPCTLDPDYCSRRSSCVTQDVWARMYDASMAVLRATTLADLVARVRERGAAGDMYYI
jgi:Rrf2 family transcriptional regulator, cysteine metabolism repressor